VLYWEGDEWDDNNSEPPDILATFPWLLRALKMFPISDSLEEIVIQLLHVNSDNHEHVPTGFRGHFPQEKFEPLFTEQFPRLRKLNLKLVSQPHHIPVLQ
jgi:hypothetical protein